MNRRRIDARTAVPAAGWGEDSVEALLAETRTRGTLIYISLLGAVLAAVLALPLIQVPITTRSPGVVRPVVETHEIRSPSAGILEDVWAREGQAVRRGDPLLRVEHPGSAARGAALAADRALLEMALRDLDQLTTSDDQESHGLLRLETARYRASWERAGRQEEAHRQRLDHLRREVERTRALVRRGVLAEAELDARRFQLEQERRAAELTRQEARLGWETERQELLSRLRHVMAEENALRSDRELGTLRAPIAGRVGEVAAVSPGSVVQAGEVLAIVSPDTVLVAEVYLDGTGAALVRPGSAVALELEGFPASDWGFLAGRVATMPSDAISVAGRSVFRVRVALDRPDLSGGSAVRIPLRSGMRVEARLQLARRTLWQLLRDDVHDWLSPSGRGPRSGGEID